MRKNPQNPEQTKYILDAACEAAKFRASLKETTACRGAARFVYTFSILICFTLRREIFYVRKVALF